MKIHRVKTSDINEIKILAVKTIQRSVEINPELIDHVIIDVHQHIDSGISNPSSIFFKYVDKEILGFLIIEDYWNFTALFVNPDYHKLGIGQTLFEFALNECRRLSNKNYIRVNSSVNAEGFYRKIGFETFVSDKAFPDYVIPLIFKF